MAFGNSFIEFALDVQRAESLQDSWGLYMEQLSEFGITYAKYGFTCFNPSEAAGFEILLVGQMCPEWEESHQEKSWYENDAIVEHCLHNKTPITFSELYRRMDEGDLTPGQMENHTVGRDAGMEHGVAFGLLDHSPVSMGGVSMEASRDFSVEEFERHLNSVFPRIVEVTELFHANVNRPSLLDPSCHPSPREKECLLWVMLGLRTDQIAFKMGTHPKTVEKQLGNVRRKLNARTNAQAAVRALVLGLVDP